MRNWRNWGQTRISRLKAVVQTGSDDNSGLIFRLRTTGFTLLEIVVSLVLIGLGTALVAPIFRRDALPDDGYPAVVSAARELAVRRAQRLVLDIDDRGQWRLSVLGDSATLGAGVLAGRGTAARLTITPLGACFHENSAGSRDWDAVACAPVGGWSR